MVRCLARPGQLKWAAAKHRWDKAAQCSPADISSESLGPHTIVSHMQLVSFGGASGGK